MILNSREIFNKTKYYEYYNGFVRARAPLSRARCSDARTTVLADIIIARIWVALFGKVLLHVFRVLLFFFTLLVVLLLLLFFSIFFSCFDFYWMAGWLDLGWINTTDFVRHWWTTFDGRLLEILNWRIISSLLLAGWLVCLSVDCLLYYLLLFEFEPERKCDNVLHKSQRKPWRSRLEFQSSTKR